MELESFIQNEKTLNFEPMPYLGTFRSSFEKTIVIFDISTAESIKNEYLTIIVDFHIGSTFSKGPRSAFSKDPGPGLL